MKVDIFDEMIGCGYGQRDMIMTASLDGVYTGHISYSIFQGDIHINYIEIVDGMQRKGLATKMLLRLYSKHDGMIRWGYTTPDGTLLKAHFLKKNPELQERTA